MLGMVLPGVRHVRTPLVTGALYLLVLWMVLGPTRLHLRTDKGSEAERRLAAAADLAGHAGVLAALGLIALLIGSLLVIERWPFTPRNYDGFGEETEQRFDWDFETWLLRQTRDNLSNVTYRDLLAPNSFDADFRRRVRDHWHHHVDEMTQGGLDQRLDEPVDEWLLSTVVASTVSAEFDLLTTRLQIEREALFNEVDRHKSEAELRYSIAPPLTLLSVVFAIQWHWLWLLGVLVAAVLAWHGYRAENKARRQVAEALRFGIIASPTLQRLVEIQRDEVQREREEALRAEMQRLSHEDEPGGDMRCGREEGM